MSRGNRTGSQSTHILAIHNLYCVARTSTKNGDVAQLVERSLSMRKVLGSIPSFSTFFFVLFHFFSRVILFFSGLSTPPPLLFFSPHV